MLDWSLGVVVTMAKRRPSRPAARMAASPMPMTGTGTRDASRSAPGSPKAATMTPSLVRRGISCTTASAAAASASGSVIIGAPNSAVSPSIARLAGAASLARASIMAVVAMDVLGLMS